MTLILLYTLCDITFNVYQITHSSTHNKSVHDVDFIGSLIPKIYCIISFLLANESTDVLEESVSQCWKFSARPQGTSDRCFFTNCQQYFMAGLFLIPLFTIYHSLLALFPSQNLTPFPGNQRRATNKAMFPVSFIRPSLAAQRADDKQKAPWFPGEGSADSVLFSRHQNINTGSLLQLYP